MTTQIDQDELIKNLKQLFVSVGAKIRSARSQEEAEELFLRLEETDPKFHKYDIVRNLHAQIDSRLEDIIDEHINNHSTHPNDSPEIHISTIVNEIKESAEYLSISDELKANLSHASSYFLSNMKVLLPSSSFSKADGDLGSSRRYDESDSESSLGDYSLNQSITFMSSEQYETVARNLRADNVESRENGLQQLLRVASLNAQGSACWESITEGISECLKDSRHNLWHLALRFIARSLSGTSSSGSKDSVNKNIKEMYILLVKFVKKWFHGHAKTNSVPFTHMGIDANQPEMEKLIKSVRLLNDFQQQVTQYWIRYDDQFVDAILKNTIELYAIDSSTSSETHLSPLHIVALIDTKAGWFSKWMHGRFSQAPLMKFIKENKQMVENIVRSCILYAKSYPAKFSGATNKQDANNTLYSGVNLEFAYFVHSVNFLSRLLWYQSGRDLFPIQINVSGKKEKISLPQFLVILTNILTSNRPDNPGLHHSLPSAVSIPPVVVGEMFKKLCVAESVCQQCLCISEVTNALLQPFKIWSKASQETDIGITVSNAAMLQAADILSAIASTSVGRHHLLYEDGGQSLSKKRDSAAHFLAKLACKLLSVDTSDSLMQPMPSTAVVGNIIFVCRQLYSSCEGLQAMLDYDLHEVIAQAWRVAHSAAEKAPTPTPSARTNREESVSVMPKDSPILWEEALCDNLLNFAATPKGLLLLLQQADAISYCVDFMYSRYSRKMQVSRCEKFGYGYMMSQIAATSCGIAALQQSGFVRALVRSAWAAVEVIEDSPIHVPRPCPVVPIDKSANKCFMKLVTLLSSYPAVVEVLGGQKLPIRNNYTFRDVPETIPELFDRLVILDSDQKYHSLFNCEQSHIFGLRLLSCMVTCLDTFLLLQTQFNIQGLLLRNQVDNVTEGSKETILDMISLECNHILVRTFSVGGPSERLLPPRTIQDEEHFPFPIVSSFPIPKEYTVDVNWFKSSKSECDLVQFLTDVKKLTTSDSLPSIDKCRRVLTKALVSKSDIPLLTYQDLLDYAVNVCSRVSKENVLIPLPVTVPDNALKNYSLTKEQELGIDLTLRYGHQLKLLSNNKDTKDKLVQLIKRNIVALQSQQKSANEHNLRYLRSVTAGYDWFVATIFILHGGNVEKCWQFLQRFSSLSLSALMWTQRMHLSAQLPIALIESTVHPTFYKTCHIIELLLQIHEPCIYSAFKMSGYTPAQICQHWIRQCFWNYLDWPDICQYLIVCLVLGIDYQVYVCVAILHFLQKDIIRRTQDRELIVFLKEEPIKDFHISDHLQYMKELETKYRETVVDNICNVLQS